MELRDAVALWGALLLLSYACVAFTVDCNQEYTDCDSELKKLAHEDDDDYLSPSLQTQSPDTLYVTVETTTPSPSRSISKFINTKPNEGPKTLHEDRELDTEATDAEEVSIKPVPRLLNLNVEDLQNFANALHNQTENINKKPLLDLSDVNLDDDVEEKELTKVKDISDKFYTNLEAPFNPLKIDKESDDVNYCKENDGLYKVGDRLERGCEEICECRVGGIFDCAPRCKHPYIRRGRRLNDPLCFESPVDECCSIIACATDTKATKVEVCRVDNNTYPVGTKWNVGCEKSCSCEKGSIVNCQPRCKKIIPNEKCINVQDPADACCEVQICDVSQDVHEEIMDNSTSTTSTSSRTFTTTTTTAESKTLLDSEEETETPDQKTTTRPLVLAEPIGSIKVLQNNSVQVNLIHLNSSEDPVHLLLSNDGGQSYKNVLLDYSNLILNLDGGKDYILKTKETGTKFNFTITTLEGRSSEDSFEAEAEELPVRKAEELLVSKNSTEEIGCHEGDKFYAVGEEFQIGCTELCECTGPETRECAMMHCPSHVGLELMSKGCVKWAPSPPAVPPNCCPRAARCLSDGTCHYKGVAIPNWSEVPISLTGCEQRCFCENGDLDCQEICTPLPPLPPQTLRCPPMHRPAPVNISDEDCCKEWRCVSNGPIPDLSSAPPNMPNIPHQPFLPTVSPAIHFPEDPHEDLPDYEQNNDHRPINSLEQNIPLPPGIQVPPNYGEENKKLSVLTIQADSPTSVKMLFGLPPVLVGLRGSVDLRYTDKAEEDVSRWYSQVFAPADEVLTTARLEFRLTGLKPSTVYKIRGKLYLHNLPVEPESDVYTVRTQDLPTVPPIEEKRREIDSRLSMTDVNDTSAHLTWRHFTENELLFIDGIQVRYRPVGTPIYSMTELLHHSRSNADLHELRPGTKYEASLVLVPPPGALTELYDPGKVEFSTSPHVDPYNWTVTIDARTVGAEAVELTWRGVPLPAERWVRVYRAAHACSGARKEHDSFRLATRDLPTSLTLTGLESNTRCRIWLELFLTNGKVKTSNVLEIMTKTLDSPEPIDNSIEAASVGTPGGRGSPRGDYYGALVVVGVVAALGALTSLLLLLVVVRRHRPRSVPITPVPSAPRESSLPPYDNPAYKLELQQETMDL